MDPSGHESGTLKKKHPEIGHFHEEQKLLSISEKFLSRNILSKNLWVFIKMIAKISLKRHFLDVFCKNNCFI